MIYLKTVRAKVKELIQSGRIDASTLPKRYTKMKKFPLLEVLERHGVDRDELDTGRKVPLKPRKRNPRPHKRKPKKVDTRPSYDLSTRDGRLAFYRVVEGSRYKPSNERWKDWGVDEKTSQIQDLGWHIRDLKVELKKMQEMLMLAEQRKQTLENDLDGMEQGQPPSEDSTDEEEIFVPRPKPVVVERRQDDEDLMRTLMRRFRSERPPTPPSQDLDMWRRERDDEKEPFEDPFGDAGYDSGYGWG